MNAGPVIVVGAGGHAKVVIDALRQCGEEIAGLVDDDDAKIGTRVMELPVLGGDNFLSERGLGPIRLATGVAAPYRRAVIFRRFKELGFAFVNVIHPSAVVSKSADIGEGTQIMAGAVVQPDVRIGENTLVNTRASVDHDCILGAHVHVAPGATLAGRVGVGDICHIGAGATVLENIRVGIGCTIGAGAVVIRDVADGVTVAGVPARPMGM